MQRRDQIGLRLHDLRAVDLEQRIAALYLIAHLGDQPRDAAGERRVHDRTCVFIKGDLPDRELLDAELVRGHRHNVELVQLIDFDAHHVRILAERFARRHVGSGDIGRNQTRRGQQQCARDDNADCADADKDACSQDRAHGLTGSVRRFHQPPPSAWNSATVSARRAACAWTRASEVCR